VIKRAALVIVLKEGKILSVSRGLGSPLWALPGGKAEQDETPSQNAHRELYEETGITAKKLVPIYDELVKGEGDKGVDFYSNCFFAEEWSGEPCHSNEGDLDWLTEEELTKTKAAFPAYNENAMKVFKQKYPNIKVL